MQSPIRWTILYCSLWLRHHGVTSRTFLEESIRPPDWCDTPAVVVEVRSTGGAVFQLTADGAKVSRDFLAAKSNCS